MSWVLLVLLALAIVVLVAAEWPRLEQRFGVEGRASRERARRKASLRLLRNEEPISDTEEFAASVERDLSRLPTIDERDGR